MGAHIWGEIGDLMIRYKNMEQVKKAFPGVAFPKPIKYEIRPAAKRRKPLARSADKATMGRIIAAADKKHDKRHQRRLIERELLRMWGKRVRDRDGNRCQWCGNPGNQPHHIVARSIANKNGWFDVSNGVTLCIKCHLFRLKSDPDEYVRWRDEWLSNKGLKYSDLRKMFSARFKMTIDDMILKKHIWNDPRIN